MPADETLPALLPSGRTVTVETAGGEERLVVAGPDGSVEVQIAFTPAGPVVRLHAARLELTSATELAVRARTLELHGEEGVRLTSAGPVRLDAAELRARTTESIHLNGATVRLNCTDEPPAGGDGGPVPDGRPAGGRD